MLPSLNVSCSDPSASVWRCQVKSSCHVVNIFVKCLSLVRRFLGWLKSWNNMRPWNSVTKNGKGNSCNAWNSLQGSCAGENTSSGVVFPLLEWWIVTCRLTSLRATLDLPNGWKQREKSLTDLGRSSQRSYQQILSKELQMKRFAAKFLPHVLTADQIQWMCSNFNHNLCIYSLHIHQISLHATSFYSSEWQMFSRENVLQTWMRWRKKRWRH
jgi:hypothetical protein